MTGPLNELVLNRSRRPTVGTAIELPGGWWLWNGVEWPKTPETQLFSFENGTYMNLKTGEVFQVDYTVMPGEAG